MSYRMYLRNIKQLVTVASGENGYLPMKDCSNLQELQKMSILIDKNGIIERIGTALQINQLVEDKKMEFQHVIDCQQYCVIPGLVDAHTHAVFAGERCKEYEMKLNGMKYADIYEAGLGIRCTTNAVNTSTQEELARRLQKYLQKMNRLGTTTVEVKSGYGLNPQSQLKMLKAIEKAKKNLKNKITVVSTFCGAHAIPKGKTEEQQTNNVIKEQIPVIRESVMKGEIEVKFIDVFCEKGFFGYESTKQILEEGKSNGMIPIFHGDELSNLESGKLGAEVGARNIAHLEYISEDSIKFMKEHHIAAVMLPTTQNIQKLPIPPIQAMREANMIVALGSDFCPNAFCYNMALTAHYACTNYRMTPKQAISAATINSAYALGIEKERGSIEVGKFADLLLLQASSWVYLVYSFGDSCISKVIKEGVIVS